MPLSYFGLIGKLSKRKELVKFRIGNHKLRTETALFVNLIKLKMNLIFLSVMH